MTIFVPGWVQGGSFTAQHDRINSRAADWDEGVASRADLKVSQRAAGANLSVDVAVGSCIVTGDDQANQGNYNVFNDAIVNLTGFTAPGSNSRYDLVVMQINDPNAGGAAGSNAVITRVAGTAAASPVIPAIPNSALLLAIVGPIVPSTTQITTAMIHDAFTGTGPTGVTGARLCQGFRDTPGTSKETYNTIAPNGWLMEDGSGKSTTTYARLFEHLGYTHGGSGATFNMPDSRGRVAVALDNMGGVDAGRLAAGNVLGGSGGAETHLLLATESGVAIHGHGVTDPTHVHGQQSYTEGLAGGNGGSNLGSNIGTNPAQTLADPDTEPAATGVTVNNHPGASAAAAHNNMPPYVLVNRIIRT